MSNMANQLIDTFISLISEKLATDEVFIDKLVMRINDVTVHNIKDSVYNAIEDIDIDRKVEDALKAYDINSIVKDEVEDSNIDQIVEDAVSEYDMEEAISTYLIRNSIEVEHISKFDEKVVKAVTNALMK